MGLVLQIIFAASAIAGIIASWGSLRGKVRNSFLVLSIAGIGAAVWLAISTWREDQAEAEQRDQERQRDNQNFKRQMTQLRRLLSPLEDVRVSVVFDIAGPIDAYLERLGRLRNLNMLYRIEPGYMDAPCSQYGEEKAMAEFFESLYFGIDFSRPDWPSESSVFIELKPVGHTYTVQTFENSNEVCVLFWDVEPSRILRWGFFPSVTDLQGAHWEMSWKDGSEVAATITLVVLQSRGGRLELRPEKHSSVFRSSKCTGVVPNDFADNVLDGEQLFPREASAVQRHRD